MSNPIKIDYEDYKNNYKENKHVFLVGNLTKPTKYPFIRDSRVEFIVCSYKTGDHGDFHWHEDLDEYEIVIEGTIGYHYACSDVKEWFRKGDFSFIPAGVCVKRLVNEPARTIAVKVPSNSSKTFCNQCNRICHNRLFPYDASAEGG